MLSGTVHFVDLIGKGEVELRQPPLVVRGQGDTDLVPAIDKDIGMMIHGLRDDGDGIDDADGRRPVGGMEFADDALRRNVVPLESPGRMELQMTLYEFLG